MDAEGPGTVDELLELDGLVSVRADGCVVVEEEEDDLPGVAAGPCRSQPARASALKLTAKIRGRIMEISLKRRRKRGGESPQQATG